MDHRSTPTGARPTGNRCAWSLLATTLLTLLPVTLELSLCRAQAYPVDQAAADFIALARSYKKSLRPMLDKPAQEILDEIQFVHEPTNEVRAEAVKERGVRKVVLSHGWLAAARDALIAYRLDKERGKAMDASRVEPVPSGIIATARDASTPLAGTGPERSCYEEFIRLVALRTIDNRDRRATRTVPRPVLTITDHDKLRHTACRHITQRELGDDRLRKSVAAQLDSVLVWIVGSAIAQHINGAVDHKAPALHDLYPCFRVDADTTSIAWAFRMRVNVLPAHPAVLFHALTDISGRVPEPANRCHSGHRRYEAFLENTQP